MKKAGLPERQLRQAHSHNLNDLLKEIQIMTTQKTSTATDKLSALLDRLFRFPHNIDKLELLERVYGPTNETNAAYKDSKLTLWEKRGFTWWYCDLDLANQRKVVEAMLERYPELEEML